MYIAPEIPVGDATTSQPPALYRPRKKPAGPSSLLLAAKKSEKPNERKSPSPPVVCRPRLNDRSSITNSPNAFHPYKGGKDESRTPRRAVGRPRRVPYVMVPPPPLPADVRRLRALLPPRRPPPVPAILPAERIFVGSGGEEDTANTSRSIATHRPRRGAVVEMFELDLELLEQGLRSRLRGTSRDL
jgi:hypothetical protein